MIRKSREIRENAGNAWQAEGKVKIKKEEVKRC